MAKLLAVWLWKAWPVWVALLLVGVHLFALSKLSEHIVLANKIVATAMQIVGGGFVLYSVDSNLGLFRSQSLVATIGAWFKACPVFHHTASTNVYISSSRMATRSSSVAVSQPFTTIEGRLAEMERQIGFLREEMAKKDQAVRERIDEVNNSLSLAITSNENALSKLTEKVVEATVGGFKQQAFGVLLVIYGAITSIFA